MPLIRLWEANLNGSPKLLTGVPSLVPYCPIWSMEKEKFISVGLSKYVDFWKVGITQSLTYEMKDEIVCGVLGRYLVAFVKTITPSKCNSFGGFLAFKRLEVQLC